ncbi:hypothetical protein [Clostridium saccharobutylicum]|uniref:Uncharacterized protein n=1 Tax=Clostridium saccharobutylicum DSM 13864 TaxID=1345695 RepID=U5MRT7_CLOSA|nr:hypothetical protein [Clostridium saccharobutylicum]AGX42147.1 hypothetical protein CLSA_c11410 [Clostridium saccharobutylicum DSM 13864]AQR89427.1 hypothetical protein CLOSC_11280 [Clostridium saccharobutylicum]AQR99329.1 hypothetical protein CSACC_11360 [Clostridium saccharobutylicum]AQS13315.1 hypothetical protein CLOSACC_11360 [Clostridium saccharobutylicum]MBA2904496.1 seryl-tRNA synthetase [Clostridium saccharobutylicum]
MSSKRHKKHSKKGKSKKSRITENKANNLPKQQVSKQKSDAVSFYEASSDNGENETINLGNNENNANINNNKNIEQNVSQDSSKSSDINDNSNASSTSFDNTNESYEELKVKQQELLNKLKNVSDSIANVALIRDNVNSIRVDTLTELYFTRQVRPLLDALNIISFASYNMSFTATTFQGNAFGDKKEIKNALKLSYKMNDEVEDIINALSRRLTIFLETVNNMDKNCPPFDFNKDS